MDFKKYQSLTNSSKTKIINWLVDNGHSQKDYIVTEKIHGANFGVHLNVVTGEIKFSRRSGFLGEDASFYSWQMVEHKLRVGIINVRRALWGIANDTISIYGELYGGGFYGEQSVGCKQVQAGVQYSPNTEFAAFDLVVDGVYLPPNRADVMRLCGLPVVPVIGIYESLQEALEVSNTFESLVPEMLGHTARTGNFAEGTVVRPYYENLEIKESILILKNKSDGFSERGGKGVKKPCVELPVCVRDELCIASTYLTANRFNNVISKELELTHKDFGRIMGLLSKDALEDYCDDYDVSLSDFKEANKEYWGTFVREFNREASVVVREYWKDNF